jgi:hypothetical protein
MGYAQDGSYSWHCPGHSGGVAFLKSPVGQMFHQFFGENILRELHGFIHMFEDTPEFVARHIIREA